MSVKLSVNVGDVFGRWEVLSEDRSTNRLKYLVKCSCGETGLVEASSLFSGRSKSCGCLHKEVVGINSSKHGFSNSATYKSWEMMIQRCRNNSIHFPKYKKDGINVCSEWRDFNNFLRDMGERPENTSLDRKDPTKGYFKENCRWASTIVQSLNKGLGCNNTSGVKGVAYNKENGRWRAYLTLKGKVLLSKSFDNKEDAISARKEAEDRYFKPIIGEKDE